MNRLPFGPRYLATRSHIANILFYIRASICHCTLEYYYNRPEVLQASINQSNDVRLSGRARRAHEHHQPAATVGEGFGSRSQSTSTEQSCLTRQTTRSHSSTSEQVGRFTDQSMLNLLTRYKIAGQPRRSQRVSLDIQLHSISPCIFGGEVITAPGSPVCTYQSRFRHAAA